MFGSTDKSNRTRDEKATNFTEQKSGIKYGIASAQWEQHLKVNDDKSGETDDEFENWVKVGSGSAVGKKKLNFYP